MERDFSGRAEVSQCPVLVPGKMAQQEMVVAAEPDALNSNFPYPHGVTTYQISLCLVFMERSLSLRFPAHYLPQMVAMAFQRQFSLWSGYRAQTLQ